MEHENSHRFDSRFVRFLLATSAVVGLASPAFAQDQGQNPGQEQTAAASADGNEILVTAQFQAQSVQDTPLAITAQTGAMLEARELQIRRIGLGGRNHRVVRAV